MTINYNGVSNTITVFGASHTMSDLVGVTGVTRRQYTSATGQYEVFELTAKLLINSSGVLTKGGNQEIVFHSLAAADGILSIADGGELICDVSLVYGSYTAKRPSATIVFALTSAGFWNTKVLNVSGSGKLRMRNQLVKIPYSIWFEPNSSGSVLLEDCVIDKHGSGVDIQTNLGTLGGTNGNNVTLRRTDIYAAGNTGLTFRSSVVPTIEQVAIIGAFDAWNNESGSAKIVRGLQVGLGNTADISQFDGNVTLAVNPQLGTQFVWAGHSPNTPGNYGTVGVYQELAGTAKTPAGTAVQGALLYLTDNIADSASGLSSLATPSGSTINPTQRQTYILTSDAAGAWAQTTVLIGHGYRTTGGVANTGGAANRVRARGVNVVAGANPGDDLYSYSVLSYAHLPQSNPVTLKGGTTGAALSLAAQLLPDASVTLSQAAALALTTIATLDQLYDAAKAWKIDGAVQARIEYLGPATYPAVASGTTLDFGALNLVIDATAASAFSINTATNTVTVKSAALATGGKFSVLKTNGTVTLANGAVVEGVYISSAGTSAGLYLFDVPAGAAILVRNGSTIDYVASFAGGDYSLPFAPGAPSGVYSWVVNLPGYGFQYGTFTPSLGGVFQATPRLVQKLSPSGDPIYTGTNSAAVSISYSGSTSAWIDIGDVGVTPQEVFDQVERSAQTEAGLIWLAAGTRDEINLVDLPSGKNIFLSGGWRLRRADAGDANAAVLGYVYSTDGTPVDDSRGGVGFLTSNTAAEIAAAVRAELATELGRIDVASSTRLAADGYTAPPTPANNAEQVRVELATELGRLDAAVSTRASQTSVDGLPGADAIAAAVWAVATRTLTANPGATKEQIAAQVRVELNTELARLDAAVTSRAAPGAAMTLTSGTISAQAVAVEAALLDEGDGQALIDAISLAIGNQNIDEVLLVAAIQSAIERVGGMLDGVRANAARIPASPAESGEYAADLTALGGAVDAVGTTVDAKPSLAQIEASTVLAKADKLALIKTKTDNLPTSPAAVGSAMTLTSAYDAAKSAASQASVAAIPTTPLLASSYTAPDNAGIAAIKTKTDNLPTSPAESGEYAADLTALAGAVDAVGTAVDARPSLAEIEASTVLAREATARAARDAAEAGL